ncbi:MAG: T9SS type A sorting domain-containing protein [Bacteroidota bacterium]
MKKTFLLCICALLFGSLSAQICTPDTNFTAPGIYPANMPDACVNQPYSFVVTLVVPQDTLVNVPPLGNLRVPIDSFILDDILGLPAGLSYQCSPASCTFLGNASYCVVVSGTPTVTGFYSLDVAVDLYSTVLATSFNAVDTLRAAFTFNVTNLPTAAITGPATVCAGDSIVLDAGSGFPAYLWSTGETTQSIFVKAAGSYGVRVGTGSCSDSTSVSVTQVSGPSVALNTHDATCAATNGAARAISTGNAPFTYTWTNGQTTDSISGLAPGNYSVTVVDANGCSDIQSFTINSTGGPTLAPASTQNVTCNGGNDGDIQVTVSGGTGPFTYSWSNGTTSQNLSMIPAGTYTLTVTDANSCVAVLTETLTEPAQAVDVLLVTSTDVSCAAGVDGSATVTITGGTLPYTYTWDTNPAQNQATATGLMANTYQVIVSDDNGCQDTLNVTIAEPAALDVTTSGVDNLFVNGMPSGEATATASGGTPPYTYSWGNGATTAMITGLSGGTYIVTITDANNCTINDTITIGEMVSIQGAFDALEQIKVYPNPTSTNLSVDLTLARQQHVRLVVVDLQGREMLSQDLGQGVNFAHNLDMGTLPSGTYLLKAWSESGSAYVRVVKE